MADQETLEHYRRIIADLEAQGIKVALNLHYFTTLLWLHNPLEARAKGLHIREIARNNAITERLTGLIE